MPVLGQQRATAIVRQVRQVPALRTFASNWLGPALRRGTVALTLLHGGAHDLVCAEPVRRRRGRGGRVLRDVIARRARLALPVPEGCEARSVEGAQSALSEWGAHARGVCRRGG